MNASLFRLFFRLTRLRSDFQRLFFEREFDILAAPGARRLWVLTLMAFITLLSLGFAIGGLKRLDERMNNPFTNWVDLPIRNDDVEKIDGVLEHFDDSTQLSRFRLKSLNGYVVLLDPVFLHAEANKPLGMKGRTIEAGETELLYKILEPAAGNWLAGWQPASPDSARAFETRNGIIATARMLEKLGYEQPLRQQKITLQIDELLPPIFIDVVAVVKELPGLCDYLCLPRLYNQVKSGIRNDNFVSLHESSNELYVVMAGEPGPAFETWVLKHLASHEPAAVRAEKFDWRSGEVHHKYKITLAQWYGLDSLKAVYKQIEAEWKSKGDCAYFQKVNFKAGSDQLESPHYLAFNFRELDKVRAFKDFMREHFKVEINMAQVEAKENFALVSRLTFIIAAILFGFGVTSIVFFVNSLLQTHLEKIKTNLGTFMAFGLSNRFLIRSYLTIVLAFLAISLLVSFAAAFLSTGLVQLIWKDSFIDMTDWRIALAVSVLFAVSYGVVANTIRRALNQTPGDLIYGR